MWAVRLGSDLTSVMAVDKSRHCSVLGRARVAWFASVILAALISFVCAEATARVYWRVCCDIPVLNPKEILYAFYPELKASGELPEVLRSVTPAQATHTDDFYDILLLGGSVLHKSWGSVETELREQLTNIGLRKVRIFNLAAPAHTSRDSWLKYAALRDARFDLVIFYHGINDARVNNAPPEIFREDYAHYSWYEAVNTLAPFHETALLALPYTLRYAVISARHNLVKDHHIPTYVVRKDWLQYGRESQSAASFKKNLSAILNLASQRGDQMLLMTFATYVPENYSREAFNKKQLDYTLHRAPIEWWGMREHVLSTVAVHNEIVRDLARRHRQVVFVDQANLMPGAGRYYNDPCHLTALGSTEFVKNIVSVLEQKQVMALVQ
jgi:hypothetical protein